ncbi:hypothetical protein [Synechococcus sp. CBW1107]|uniref:hypothetical protein n=1 Tax=Synechococcus sp. CBW1107 TaxID=2789857 RepID=UPI001E4F2076|nr:hypothetical protein [Synechococcus sp. CBW1107]
MMKAAGSSPHSSASIPPLRLVLVGAASVGAAAGVEDAANRLGALLGVVAMPPLLAATTGGTDAPVEVLMAELSRRGGSWVVPLPQDPGGVQPWGGRWSELLGAWRQPTVLLIDAQQADGGLPAASTALLQLGGVPLLGLIQWGGRFDREARRRDGLPWLGALVQGDGADADADLSLSLRRRWNQVAADAA